jgi:hypothetical protein
MVRERVVLLPLGFESLYEVDQLDTKDSADLAEFDEVQSALSGFVLAHERSMSAEAACECDLREFSLLSARSKQTDKTLLHAAVDRPPHWRIRHAGTRISQKWIFSWVEVIARPGERQKRARAEERRMAFWEWLYLSRISRQNQVGLELAAMPETEKEEYYKRLKAARAERLAAKKRRRGQIVGWALVLGLLGWILSLLGVVHYSSNTTAPSTTAATSVGSSSASLSWEEGACVSQQNDSQWELVPCNGPHDATITAVVTYREECPPYTTTQDLGSTPEISITRYIERGPEIYCLGAV